jgi:hypothetical protein
MHWYRWCAEEAMADDDEAALRARAEQRRERAKAERQAKAAEDKVALEQQLGLFAVGDKVVLAPGLKPDSVLDAPGEVGVVQEVSRRKKHFHERGRPTPTPFLVTSFDGKQVRAHAVREGTRTRTRLAR